MACKFSRSAAFVLCAGLLVGAAVAFGGCAPLSAAGDSVLNILPGGGLSVAVRTELTPDASGNMALASQTVMPQGGGGTIATDINTTPAAPDPVAGTVQRPGVPVPTVGAGNAGALTVAVTAPTATADPPGTPVAADLGDAAGTLTNVVDAGNSVTVTPASTNTPLLLGPTTGGWDPALTLATNMTVEKAGLSQEINQITLVSDQVGAIPDVLITVPGDRAALSGLRVLVDPASVPANYNVTVQAVATVKQTDANGAVLTDANGAEAEGTVTVTGTGAVGASIALDDTATWTTGTQLGTNTGLTNDLLTSDNVTDPNNANNDTLAITVTVAAP